MIPGGSPTSSVPSMSKLMSGDTSGYARKLEVTAWWPPSSVSASSRYNPSASSTGRSWIENSTASAREELDGGVARLGQRHLRHLVHLEEHRVQRLDEGDVEAVHPHHRPVGLIAVIVPRPARRQDEVAGRHVDALAVDGGVGPLALHDE